VVVSPFPVVDVSDWPVAIIEPRGVEPKTWLREPATDVRWLFKPVSRVAWGEQGEDWAEKITTEVANLLNVPCAAVEYARRGAERGTISRDLAAPPYQLFTGAVLLSGVVPNYRPGAHNIKGRPGHTLANIRAALAGHGTPPGHQAPTCFSAFDVFVGYLMLDALVSNRDRHDENWAVLRPPPPAESDLLCGSYDHGSALGFGLTDARRALFVRECRVDQWSVKGTAHRFEHTGKPVTLVEFARQGLRTAGDSVYDYWLERLHSVSDESIAGIVGRSSSLSEPARTFIVELLRVNRGRLLDECSDRSGS